ncbi:hypothetical protein [Pontibacter pamirensis]|uniref:hypothetical protein n=1 Tax=Pontibacter pamirensis TaxID=2562824 RepID=UPI00138A25DF|nr:hypothetical protein [Pontibacter pamirensis]
MKTIPVLFALIGFILMSCSKEEQTVSPLNARPAPVVQVDAPETASFGENVTVTVYFLVNNGCGEFGSFEATRSGNTITVEVYPHYREGFCTQALETREVIYTYKPEEAGTYTFKFWAGEDQFITKTIVIE